VKAEKVPQYYPLRRRIIYDQFHIMKHAGVALDEVRRVEFFREGGAAWAVGKGKRWLLQSRWMNLNTQKIRQVNALFAAESATAVRRGQPNSSLFRRQRKTHTFSSLLNRA
jgi:Transposase